jgi:hypothetical protein
LRRLQQAGHLACRILLAVLYWCEIWYLTLREEHMLRKSENRVLRRIFRPEREEWISGWNKIA